MLGAAPQTQRSSMKKTKHTAEQIITKLRKVEALTTEGATIAEAAKQIGVSEQTLYRWKKRYGSMDRDELRRLKELEKENARLKKLVAEQALDIDILKEVAKGNF
jgi:putative transposase